MIRALLFLLTVASAPSWGVELKAFTGKLNNYTSISNDLLEVTYELRCRDYSLVGPHPSCGYAAYTASVKSDGTFDVPTIEVPNGYENDLQVRVNVKFENRGDFKPYFRSWSFDKRDIRGAISRLQKFSLYETLPAEITYNVQSSRAEFLAGKGRDLYNSFMVFFPDAEKFAEDDYDPKDETRLTSDNGLDDKPGRLPHAFLVAAGDLPANTPFRVKGSSGNSSYAPDGKIEVTKPFEKNWNIEQRTFTLDESKLIAYPRYINGNYDQSRLAFKIEEGTFSYTYYDGDFLPECVGGVVKGVLKVDSTQLGGSDFKYKGESELSGTCNADTATIEFTIPYRKDRDAEKMTITLDRMTRGHWYARSPYDGWYLSEPKGTLNPLLPVKNSKGEIIGELTVR